MAKKTTTPKKKAAADDERLIPPPDGVTVRMYRIGHGDCFLVAFPGKKATEPVYVLIDCGYKPGSPAFIDTTPKKITDNIRTATGGHLDVAIVTHEHQDHVNAVTQTHFKDVTIGEAWFAWTEDPDDDVANDLRTKFKDTLLGLLAARNRLASAADAKEAAKIDRFLAFEIGGDEEQFNAAAAAALLGASATSSNKKSMKIFKDRAEKGVKYIRPHQRIFSVPGVKDIRVFAFGPPRDPELLKSLDPVDEEGFHLGLTARSAGAYFGLAARAADDKSDPQGPFDERFRIEWTSVKTLTGADGDFLRLRYGVGGDIPAPRPVEHESESESNAEWRRIDNDWLYATEQLALDLNDQTNNSSLVLAFELGKGGKVLLFAADAQRGNWISWSKKTWKDGDDRVSVRELLSRCVLYKVGHHGSHNATLNGTPEDEYPNIAWMAEGDHGREFTAMITAVRKWAETQDGWDHPLKAIKDALLKRAAGRVFQTDTDFADMQMPADGSIADWNSFQDRAAGRQLYFDYTVRM